MNTQTEKILNHLKRYGSITPMVALNRYGVFRLASRISDLKRQGVSIVSERVKVRVRDGSYTYVSKYSLED